MIPSNEITAQRIEGYKVLEMREFKEVRKVRCPKLHGKYFAMISSAFRNLPECFGEMTFDQYRKSVTIAAGYYDEMIVPIEDELVLVRQAKSISYAKMDQDEFELLYKSTHIALCKYYGMGELEEFVLGFM